MIQFIIKAFTFLQAVVEFLSSEMFKKILEGVMNAIRSISAAASAPKLAS